MNTPPVAAWNPSEPAILAEYSLAVLSSGFIPGYFRIRPAAQKYLETVTECHDLSRIVTGSGKMTVKNTLEHAQLVFVTRLVGDFLTTPRGDLSSRSTPVSAGFLELCKKPTNNVTVTF